MKAEILNMTTAITIFENKKAPIMTLNFQLSFAEIQLISTKDLRGNKINLKYQKKKRKILNFIATAIIIYYYY